MDPRVAAAVDRVTDQKVPDELSRGLHEANAAFHDVRQRLDALAAGDQEQGHQGRVDALTGEFREAEQAVEQASRAVHDHLNRPASGG